MNRLTKWREDDYGGGTKMYYTNGKISSGIVYIDDNKNFTNMAIDKLGQLEDIEDELGFGLQEAYNLIGKDVFCLADVQDTKTGEILKDYITERRVWKVDLLGTLYVGSSWSFSEYRLKDYGKTWAFTKEELL